MLDPYLDKFERMHQQTLYPLLCEADRAFIKEIAFKYRFSFQDLKIVSDLARDLAMWGGQTLSELWSLVESETSLNAAEQLQQRKKRLLSLLNKKREALCAEEKSYGEGFTKAPPSPRLDLVEEVSSKKIFGDCPVYSDKTLCCGLKTIDAVQNCGFACSYCTIQTFYGDHRKILFDGDLKEKLRSIEVDPNRFYHFGTGQSSDSLMWGNSFGILDNLCEFAADHPNVLLEFKTKSANVDYFKNHTIPKNVVCSWTLNSEAIIRNEEHFTSSLNDRISAAEVVAARGVKVAFHFHPMIYYKGWDSEYPAIIERLLKTFVPAQISFISMGSVTFIKPVIQEIRRRGGITKILQMNFSSDPLGKLTYADEIKLKLFKCLYSALEAWHKKVFIYLCMEKPEIWDALFGAHYQNNQKFHDALCTAALKGF